MRFVASPDSSLPIRQMLRPVVIAAGAAIALLFFAVYRTIRQYYALKQFGGPWSVGFSRLWLLWANGSGKMHLVFTDVNDEYGKRIDNHVHQSNCLQITNPVQMSATPQIKSLQRMVSQSRLLL